MIVFNITCLFWTNCCEVKLFWIVFISRWPVFNLAQNKYKTTTIRPNLKYWCFYFDEFVIGPKTFSWSLLLMKCCIVLLFVKKSEKTKHKNNGNFCKIIKSYYRNKCTRALSYQRQIPKKSVFWMEFYFSYWANKIF